MLVKIWLFVGGFFEAAALAISKRPFARQKTRKASRYRADGIDLSMFLD
jgi:hypothetical protein